MRYVPRSTGTLKYLEIGAWADRMGLQLSTYLAEFRSHVSRNPHSMITNEALEAFDYLLP